jgi:hypothetical protein
MKPFCCTALVLSALIIPMGTVAAKTPKDRKPELLAALRAQRAQMQAQLHHDKSRKQDAQISLAVDQAKLSALNAAIRQYTPKALKHQQ